MLNLYSKYAKSVARPFAIFVVFSVVFMAGAPVFTPTVVHATTVSDGNENDNNENNNDNNNNDNEDSAGTLTVIKHVVGGDSSAGDFTITVTGTAVGHSGEGDNNQNNEDNQGDNNENDNNQNDNNDNNDSQSSTVSFPGAEAPGTNVAHNS